MRREFLWSLALLAMAATARLEADDKQAPPPAPVRPSPSPPVATPGPARTSPAPTPEQSADAVLAARAAKDDARLGALAALDEPDPWLVVDLLLTRGKSTAADAFARAAPRKDVEGLAAHIASRIEKPLDRPARDALAAAITAHGEGNDPRAIEILGGGPSSDDPIAAVRAGYVKGLALRGARRLVESAEAFEIAGAQAKAIGWLARADRSMYEAGMSAMSASEWRHALAAWEARIPIAKARGDDRAVAVTLGKLSSISKSLSDYPRALEFEEQALDIWSGLKDRVGIAEALGHIGSLRQALGDYPRALEIQGRALALQRELDDRAGIARTLGHMGSLESALGDYLKALDLTEEALKLHEELGNKAEIARTLGAIGNIRHYLGDCRGAIEVQGRALQMMEALGDGAGSALTLGSIGAIHCSLQDYPRALEIQQKALALKESLGDRTGIASSLENIGLIYQSQGDDAKALTFYKRALVIREELGDRAGVAAVLGSIGYIHEMLEQFQEALETQERALVMAQRLGAQELVLERLAGLAHTLLAHGDAEQAVEMAHRAVDVLGRLSSGLAEEQGTKTREQYEKVFEIGARAAVLRDDASEVAFFLESGRAATLLEALGGRDALRAFVIPDELRMEEARARATEAGAQEAHTAALDRGVRAEIRVTKKTLADAQSKVGEVIERIQRQAKAAASVVYPKADALDVIEGRLKPGEALVLYGVFSETALALVVSAKEARIVPLGKAKEIRDACDAENWDTLRMLVVDPLGLTTEVRRLLVSPMGALASVPFCALAPAQEIVYVPSGTTYGVILDEVKKRGDRVLALGDPDYTHKDGAREGAIIRGSRRMLAPLPATRDEATAIGDHLLLGADATESALRENLLSPQRWHAIHLACHGIVNAEKPKLSALALSKGQFLTMIEVFRMKIQSDLCVLSACDTARGKVYATEGVEGFVRAFLFAGAPRVIVSLWKVDDRATQALMTKFYELWNPIGLKIGLPAATALRQAQAFVRAQEKWKEPVFWAAWQLWGLPE